MVEGPVANTALPVNEGASAYTGKEARTLSATIKLAIRALTRFQLPKATIPIPIQTRFEFYAVISYHAGTVRGNRGRCKVFLVERITKNRRAQMT
jgi:hypothetical protein